MSETSLTEVYDTLVVGGGPAGLTAVACMMDSNSKRLLWIDPNWNAGRVGERYREVPR